MKKKFLLAVAAVFFFAFAFAGPREASAIPAFARQTGLACSSCHFQHFPELNAFGRAFKEGGFTMVGGQSMVEGDALSIPATLNATLLTKLKYDRTNSKEGKKETKSVEGQLGKGDIQFPSDAGIFLAGRAGEHLGFLFEMSLMDGDSANRFSAFKMPIVFDAYGTKLLAIPFTTDSNGVSYGFEVLNTGALNIHRTLEHGTESSAQMYINTTGSSGNGPKASIPTAFTQGNATGIAFVAAQPLWFVNYTPWKNTHGSGDTNPIDATTALHYVRAAVTPNLGGWDLALGGQLWRGSEKHFDTVGPAPIRDKADAWAIDAQAQGMAGNFPLGVYFSYADAPKTKDATLRQVNIYNTSTHKDKSAYAVTAELGVIPNKLAVSAAYRAGKTGDPGNIGKDEDNATTFGITYNPLQNLQVTLNQSWYSGDGRVDRKAVDANGAPVVYGNESAGNGANSLTSLTVWAAF